MVHKSTNIVWESKGVLLGIIKYILKNGKRLIDSDIIVENDRFRRILKILFSHFTFKKIGKGFEININNRKRRGLVINNIGNLDYIETNNVVLLPWYDLDNPIVMFEYEKGVIVNNEIILSKIQAFNRDRFRMWSVVPTFIDTVCKVQIWDTFMENKILTKYCKKYGKDIRKIHLFISRALQYPCCDNQEVRQIYVPQYIPINVNKTNVEELIGDLTKKVDMVNEIINKR